MPLQKSFSDQDGSTKTRQRWHKSMSHSALGQRSTAASAPASRPRPLGRVADATKQKINSFNFVPPTEESTQENTPGERMKQTSVDENDNPLGRDPVPLLPRDLPSDLPSDSMKHLRTPVHRLAWQDLIGDSDAKGQEEDASPQEKIGWDTRQKPMYGVSPMPRKRGSKRARSSSPVSSPAVSSRSMTPAVNIKRLSAALKSPRADPAIELWDRFSVCGSAATTPSGPNNPALAQAMLSSSPQPTKLIGTGRGDASLRRTISCGANWPKRRRTERTETPSISFAIEESPTSDSKSSMVNALLKSVTGELSRSRTTRTRPEVPESPSPRKKRYNPADHLSGSPKRRVSPSKPMTRRLTGASGVSKEPRAADSLSDYGDDDFDDDTLMSLDVDVSPTLNEGSQPLSSRTRMGLFADMDPALKHTSRPPPPPQTPVSRQNSDPKNPAAQSADTLLDEFADLDDDVFADADDLLSQIDSACDTGRRAAGSQAHNPANAVSQGSVFDEPAEDVYGDDFGGDFDFEAAEIAATQSTKQSSGSVPFVRKSCAQYRVIYPLM
ncbi:putative DNA replication ATP-dependent helicase Dna2 [Rosellinia necatrix]|uniref:Putative DNA replication ATP-dependent helicase Dna2 n=1 Tax=Rosellinia necatrix TaxID=77044 RepID=A0A1S8A8H3_ROSNE|nr:putative DNA replication ATP-dependent helicase Dna2 [Rosellinia necatrix]